MNTTTFDRGHSHRWKNGDVMTEVWLGHAHPINLPLMIAERGNSKHSHRLIIKRSKQLQIV